MGPLEQFDCMTCLDPRRTSGHCYPFDITLSESGPCRSRWLITERKNVISFQFLEKHSILKDEKHK